MKELDQMIKALLLILPGGAGVRAVVILLRMQADPDQASLYKRRLVNLLIFLVIAESVVALLNTILSYFYWA